MTSRVRHTHTKPFILAGLLGLTGLMLPQGGAAAIHHPGVFEDVAAYKSWLAGTYGAIPGRIPFDEHWRLKPICRSLQTYGLFTTGHSARNAGDPGYFYDDHLLNPIDGSDTLIPTDPKDVARFTKPGIPIHQGGSSLGMLKRPVNVAQGVDLILPVHSPEIRPLDITVARTDRGFTPDTPSFTAPEITHPTLPERTPRESVSLAAPSVTRPEITAIGPIELKINRIEVAQQSSIQTTTPSSLPNLTVEQPATPPLLAYPQVSEAVAPEIPELGITPEALKVPGGSGANPNSDHFYFGPIPKSESEPDNYKSFFQDVSLESGVFTTGKNSITATDVRYNTDVVGFDNEEKLSGKIVVPDKEYKTAGPKPKSSSEVFNFDSSKNEYLGIEFFFAMTNAPYVEFGEKVEITTSEANFKVIDYEIEDKSGALNGWTIDKHVNEGFIKPEDGEKLKKLSTYGHFEHIVDGSSPYNTAILLNKGKVSLDGEKSEWLITTEHTDGDKSLRIVENAGTITTTGAGATVFHQTPDVSSDQTVIFRNSGKIQINGGPSDSGKKRLSTVFLVSPDAGEQYPHGLMVNDGDIIINADQGNLIGYNKITSTDNHFTINKPAVFNAKGCVGLLNASPLNLQYEDAADTLNYLNLELTDKAGGSIGVLQNNKNSHIKTALNMKESGLEKTIGVFANDGSVTVSKGSSNPYTGALRPSSLILDGGSSNVGLLASNTGSKIFHHGAIELKGGENNVLAIAEKGAEVVLGKDSTLTASSNGSSGGNVIGLVAKGENSLMRLENGASLNFDAAGRSVALIAEDKGTLRSEGSTLGIHLKADGAKTAAVVARSGGKVDLKGSGADRIRISGEDVSSVLYVKDDESSITLENTDVIAKTNNTTTTAAYTHGGAINLVNSTLHLFGGSVGYNLEKTGSGNGVTAKVTFDNNSSIHVHSNDALIFNFPDNPDLELTTSEVTTGASIGNITKPNIVVENDPATNAPADGYLLGAFSGAKLTLNDPLVYTTENSSGRTFYRNIAIQKGRIDVQSNVTLQLESGSETAALSERIVGLNMSSDYANKNSSWIHVQEGRTITVDRLPAGDGKPGGTGLYANFASIENAGVLEIESEGHHHGAMGVYSINAPVVTNAKKGAINVHGDGGIGIFASSARKSNGTVYDHVDYPEGAHPTLNVTNEGVITLDGKGGTGIHAVNPVGADQSTISRFIVKNNGSIHLGAGDPNNRPIGLFLDAVKLEDAAPDARVSLGADGIAVFATNGAVVGNPGEVVFREDHANGVATALVLKEGAVLGGFDNLVIDNTALGDGQSVVGIHYEAPSTGGAIPVFHTAVDFRKNAVEGLNSHYFLDGPAVLDLQGHTNGLSLKDKELMAVAARPGSTLELKGILKVAGKKAVGLQSLGESILLKEGSIEVAGENALGAYLTGTNTGAAPLLKTEGSSTIRLCGEKTIGVLLENTTLETPAAVSIDDGLKETLAYKIAGNATLELPGGSIANPNVFAEVGEHGTLRIKGTTTFNENEAPDGHAPVLGLVHEGGQVVFDPAAASILLPTRGVGLLADGGKIDSISLKATGKGAVGLHVDAPSGKDVVLENGGRIDVSQGALGIDVHGGRITSDRLTLGLGDGAVGLVIETGGAQALENLTITGLDGNTGSGKAVLAHYLGDGIGQTPTNTPLVSYQYEENPHGGLSWIEGVLSNKFHLRNTGEHESTAPVAFAVTEDSVIENTRSMKLHGDSAVALISASSGGIENAGGATMTLDTTSSGAALINAAPAPGGTVRITNRGTLSVTNAGAAVVATGNTAITNAGRIDTGDKATGIMLIGPNASLKNENGTIHAASLGLFLDEAGARKITGPVIFEGTKAGAASVFAQGSRIDFPIEASAPSGVENVVGLYAASKNGAHNILTGNISMKGKKSTALFLEDVDTQLGTETETPEISIDGEGSVGVLVNKTASIKNVLITAKNGSAGLYSTPGTGTERRLTVGGGTRIIVDEKSFGIAAAPGVDLVVGDEASGRPSLVINGGTGIHAPEGLTLKGLDVEFTEKGGVAIDTRNTDISLDNIHVTGTGQLLDAENIGLKASALELDVHENDSGFAFRYKGGDDSDRILSFGKDVAMTLHNRATGISVVRGSDYTQKATLEFNGTINPSADGAESSAGLHLDGIDGVVLGTDSRIMGGVKGASVYMTNTHEGTTFLNKGVITPGKNGAGLLIEEGVLPGDLGAGHIHGTSEGSSGIELIGTTGTTTLASDINLEGGNANGILVLGGSNTISGARVTLGQNGTGIRLAPGAVGAASGTAGLVLTGETTINAPKGSAFAVSGGQSTLTLGEDFNGHLNGLLNFAAVDDGGRLVIESRTASTIGSPNGTGTAVGLVVRNGGSVTTGANGGLALTLKGTGAVGAYIEGGSVGNGVELHLDGQNQIGAYLKGATTGAPMASTSAGALNATLFFVDSLKNDLELPAMNVTSKGGVGVETKSASGATSHKLTLNGIDVSGSGAAGVLNRGGYELHNKGTLTVNTEAPAIGLYSSGGHVTQSGTASVSGNGSVGILSEDPSPAGTTVVTVENGMTVGDGAVGVLSKGPGTVVFKGGLNVMGPSAGVAVPEGRLEFTGPLVVDDGAVGLKLGRGGHDVRPDAMSIKENGIGIALSGGAGAEKASVTLQTPTMATGGYGVVVEDRPNVDINISANPGMWAPHSTGVYVTGTESRGITVEGDFTAPPTLLNPADPNDPSGHKLGAGLFIDNGADVLYKGTLTVDSRYSVGAILDHGSTLTIDGSSVINVSGSGYGVITNDAGSTLVNKGVINVKDEGSTGVALYKGRLVNEGTISISNEAVGVFQGAKAGAVDASGIVSTDGTGEPVKESEINKPVQWGDVVINKEGVVTIGGGVVNAGAIVVAGRDLELADVAIDIRNRFDDGTVQPVGKPFFEADRIKGRAKVLPTFTQGNNKTVFHTEDLFKETDEHGVSNGAIAFNGVVYSDSVSWLARVTSRDMPDGSTLKGLTMAKIPYVELITGSENYKPLAAALDELYVETPSGTETGRLFDAIDMINDDDEFARSTAALRGDLYANLPLRALAVDDAFERGRAFLASQPPLSRDTVKAVLLGQKDDHDDGQPGRTGWDVRHAGILVTDERAVGQHDVLLGLEAGYLDSKFDFTDGVSDGSSEKVRSFRLGVSAGLPLVEGDRDKLVARVRTSVDVMRHKVKRNLHVGTEAFTNTNRLRTVFWKAAAGLEYLHDFGGIEVLAGAGVEHDLARTGDATESGAVPLKFIGRTCRDVRPFLELGARGGHALGAGWRADAELTGRVTYSVHRPWDERSRVSVAGSTQPAYELPGTSSRRTTLGVTGRMTLSESRGFTFGAMGSVDNDHDRYVGLQVGFKW